LNSIPDDLYKMWSRLISLSILSTLLALGHAQGADWDSAYSQAKTALAKLSQSEKIGIVTGTGWEQGPCVGNTGSASSIGFRSFCTQDGPTGVRYAQNVSAFPAGIMAVSTWDRDLLNTRGAAMGDEAKTLGVNLLLGPVSGPLGKIPVGGRNWEGFSPDPYLAGIAMQETITGLQGAGAQACAKHYIGNEQELNRDSMSSNIDGRTLHELYLWPFADAVYADVASVMCSYNKLNSSWSCENEYTLTDVLKGELGFKGYVISDWAAQHTTTGSANAGLDMTMPGDNFGDNQFLWGNNLASAISSGQVQQSRLDDMVTRILAAWYLTGQDSGYPAVAFSSWNGGSSGLQVQKDHAEVCRAIARDGIVLLKNDDNILPLSNPGSIAIIGQDAINNPNGINSCNDRACDTGTLAVGWGSGTTEFPYLIAPLDAIKSQAPSGTTFVTSTTDTISSASSAAAAADTAIVFINSDSGEGYLTVEGVAGDRNNLDPWHSGNDLVAAVAGANDNTIVVVHSVGPLVLESILSHSGVKAIVWAGLPGEESGNGLADILFGNTSPSGKLVYTIAKQTSDYGTSVVSGTDSYPEGLYIDYRHFDKANIEPRYEFGFGLCKSLGKAF
jgi:beta-glucosidase